MTLWDKAARAAKRRFLGRDRSAMCLRIGFRMGMMYGWRRALKQGKGRGG